MDYKKVDAPNTIITRDLVDFEKFGNLYEALAAISKRGDQIGVEMKEELNSKLEEFASTTDNLEEIFENREQIEISKYYESLPKPIIIALQEFLDDKIYFRNPVTENTSKE